MDIYELFTACLQIPYKRVGVSANYAIKREGNTLYVFFEGSDGKIDWKNNLDFPAKAYKKRTWFAHRGFLRVWKEIEPFLSRTLANKSVKKIVIAGYSHGGALAMLCHEYVWYHRPDLRENIEGYGFGAPRVFWGIKTKALKERWANFYTIRNAGDIVTHLPPWIFGYSHVGKMVKIGKRGRYSPIKAHYAENILKELSRFSP